ncbi:MAG: sugar ABC transporter substrate-binding protein [Clostridiales bacterium]|nr:sugar ABC transporter substrate-binding protein [Clostridiales bacterium]
MKKLTKLTTLLLALAMVLTLCVSAYADEEVIEITYFDTLLTEKEAPMIQAMAQKYMELHPNVKITGIGVPVNDMATKITTLAANDDLPDGFFMPTEFMGPAKDMGIILDPTPYLDQEWLDSVIPGCLTDATMEGQLMFVPWHYIPQGVVYRTDWLAEAGMETIETWDDFTKAAKAFTKDLDNDGRKDQWGFSMVSTRNGSGETRFVNFVRSFGVDEAVKDADGKWTLGLTDSRFQDALKYFVDLALVEDVVPPGLTETGYPEAAAYFAQEKTGLMVTGSNALGAILSDNPNLKGKLGSIPIPMAERHVCSLQTSGIAITTSCEHPEVFADFLQFITSPEIAIEFAVNSGRFPVVAELASDPTFDDPMYQGFMSAAQYAYPPQLYPSNGELLDIMGEAYTTMLSGTSLEDAMERVNERAEELAEEY